MSFRKPTHILHKRRLAPEKDVPGPGIYAALWVKACLERRSGVILHLDPDKEHVYKAFGAIQARRVRAHKFHRWTFRSNKDCGRGDRVLLCFPWVNCLRGALTSSSCQKSSRGYLSVRAVWCVWACRWWRVFKIRCRAKSPLLTIDCAEVFCSYYRKMQFALNL